MLFFCYCIPLGSKYSPAKSFSEVSTLSARRRAEVHVRFWIIYNNILNYVFQWLYSLYRTRSGDLPLQRLGHRYLYSAYRSYIQDFQDFRWDVCFLVKFKFLAADSFGITLRLFEGTWSFYDANVEYVLALQYLEVEGSTFFFFLNTFVASEKLKIPCHITCGILTTDVSLCGNRNIWISC